MTRSTGHNSLTPTAEGRMESNVSQKDSYEGTRGNHLGIFRNSGAWTRSSWRAKDREPTKEFHYSKLGLERRETEYRSGGVTLSPKNPLASSNQTNREGTQGTSSLHQDLLK